jgi:dihydrofolate reductase
MIWEYPEPAMGDLDLVATALAGGTMSSGPLGGLDSDDGRRLTGGVLVRKLFWFNMSTLDGYHESRDGELFWHDVDEEFHDFAVAQLDEADTLMFGRKTYQMMAAFWPTPAGEQADPRTAERMNGFAKAVVSRTLTAAGWGPATVISDDVAGQVAALKELPGKDIALLGSSTLAASLLDAGLLDELRTMINPVVLGGGHSSLAGASPADLELADVRQFRSGKVLLTHRPRP